MLGTSAACAATAVVFAGCSEEAPSAVSSVDAGPSDAAVSPAPDAAPADPCASDVMPDGLPGHLECTGLYADIGQKALAEGVRPYAPGAAFWSDGAEKSRFVYLPPGSVIDTSNVDEWILPQGTKLWKEFALDGRRLETRLYWKTTSGTGKQAWKQTVYRWTGDEKTALRLDAGELVPRDGGPAYEIPSSGQCQDCHSGRAEPVLGFDAVGLGLPAATGLTLATLAGEGRLSAVPSKTALAIPDDGTAKAASAIGWLHANCGSCHNPSSSAGASYTNTFFLVRASQLLGSVDGGRDLDALRTTCGLASSSVHPDGGAALKRIAAGSPDTSSVAVLAGSRAPAGVVPNANQQMPPLVTHVVDPEGLAAVRAWITAVPSCP